MRLIPLLLLLILLPAAGADDLDLTITTEPFFSEEAGTYKLIVSNSDGMAPEYINFTLEYWISDSNEILSNYPKTTNNDLKSKRTISRQWTPQSVGFFSICAKIISTTTNDPNPDNDYFCSEVSVAGQVNTDEADISIAEEDLADVDTAAAEADTDEAERAESEVNISLPITAEENQTELTLTSDPPPAKAEIVLEQKPDTIKVAMFLFIIALLTVLIGFLFKIYKDLDML